MGVKHECTLVSQGVKTGERVVLQIVRPAAKLKTLEELGMRDKMRDQFKEMIESRSGLVILSAPPGGGLTTSWHVTVRAKDRYVKECVSVENVAQREEEVENVTVATFNLPGGETPDKMLPQLLLRQPDVLFVPDMVNGATIDILCSQVLEEDRLVLGRIPAKDAVDSLVRTLALKPEPTRFSKAVIAALGQRLIRKLCQSCKQAYEPNPQLLQRLGIPPGRVHVFYREYQPPPPEQLIDNKGRPIAPPPPCAHCQGLGYLGRTAIFELLTVDDRLRQGLAQNADANTLRQLARQSGHRGLQEEGILLVAQGITSIQELQRVLAQ
jgi:type II secretory ATPase GspE/PulE/Tfp pilus assembly ATPase PilB-like protein